MGKGLQLGQDLFMGFEAVFTLAVVVVTLVLLITDKFPVDMVTLGTVVALLLGGVLTPEEAVKGFSNPATITVAGMLILSAAISQSGALSALAKKMARADRKGSAVSLALPLMLVVGCISAFINNTAAVAIFLPLTLELARRTSISPSRLLLPLSYASLFGGVCTLLGTSTNILVASLAKQQGLPAFSIFEFLPVGLLFFFAGVIYMVLVGIPNLPDRGAPDIWNDYNVGDYLTELRILPGSPNAGRPLAECPLTREIELDVLSVRRNEHTLEQPGPGTHLRVGDLLTVRCKVDELYSLSRSEGVELYRVPEFDRTAGIVLIEAAVSPNSRLRGKTLKDVNFRKRFGCNAVAIRHFETVKNNGLSSYPLKGGDIILLQVPTEELPHLRSSPELLLLGETEMTGPQKWKKLFSLGAMAVTVLLAATEILPIVSAVLLGCLLVFLTRALEPEEAYKRVEWQVVMLLGGMLALGEALEKTGVTALLAQKVTLLGQLFGPVALVSGLYLLTSLLTEVLSNNATAVLLVPIAVQAAQSLGVDPKPLVMAICFAASASFMTPIGYQTNTLVFGPGRYKFKDYLKVGTPLNLLFWGIASVAIPYYWPL